MSRPDIKKKAQVILELVMVFICLAFLGYFAVKAFSNLNSNMVERVKLFKDSRKLVTNAPVTFNYAGLNQSVPIWSVFDAKNPKKAISDPLTYLDYGPYAKVLGDTRLGRGINPGGGWTGNITDCLEDLRLAEAARLLEEEDLIINVVGPYKINQAYYLFKQGKWTYSTYVSLPEGYLTTTEILCRQSKSLGERAWGDLENALKQLELVLKEPLRPGPFDPIFDPKEYPDEDKLDAHLKKYYGLDPRDPNFATAKEDLKRRHKENCDNLQQMIDNLNSAKPGLELMLYGRYTDDDGNIRTTQYALIPYLDSILSLCGSIEYNINNWGCYWGARQKLKDLVDFVGGIYPSSPTSPKKLPADLVALTEKVYTKLDNLIKDLEKNQFSITSAQAKEITQQAKADAVAIPGMLASLSQTEYPFLYQEGLDGKTIIENLKDAAIGLNSNLNAVLTDWDTRNKNGQLKLDENERLEFFLKARSNALTLKVGCANPPTGKGDISGCILKNSDGLVGKIEALYGLLANVKVASQDKPRVQDAAGKAEWVRKNRQISKHPLLLAVARQLKGDSSNEEDGVLDYALINWKNEGNLQKRPQYYYLQFGCLHSWAFYRVTDVNRLLTLRTKAGNLAKNLDNLYWDLSLNRITDAAAKAQTEKAKLEAQAFLDFLINQTVPASLLGRVRAANNNLAAAVAEWNKEAPNKYIILNYLRLSAWYLAQFQLEYK